MSTELSTTSSFQGGSSSSFSAAVIEASKRNSDASHDDNKRGLRINSMGSNSGHSRSSAFDGSSSHHTKGRHQKSNNRSTSPIRGFRRGLRRNKTDDEKLSSSSHHRAYLNAQSAQASKSFEDGSSGDFATSKEASHHQRRSRSRTRRGLRGNKSAEDSLANSSHHKKSMLAYGSGSSHHNNNNQQKEAPKKQNSRSLSPIRRRRLKRNHTDDGSLSASTHHKARMLSGSTHHSQASSQVARAITPTTTDFEQAGNDSFAAGSYHLPTKRISHDESGVSMNFDSSWNSQLSEYSADAGTDNNDNNNNNYQRPPTSTQRQKRSVAPGVVHVKGRGLRKNKGDDGTNTGPAYQYGSTQDPGMIVMDASWGSNASDYSAGGNRNNVKNSQRQRSVSPGVVHVKGRGLSKNNKMDGGSAGNNGNNNQQNLDSSWGSHTSDLSAGNNNNVNNKKSQRQRSVSPGVVHVRGRGLRKNNKLDDGPAAGNNNQPNNNTIGHRGSNNSTEQQGLSDFSCGANSIGDSSGYHQYQKRQRSVSPGVVQVRGRGLRKNKSEDGTSSSRQVQRLSNSSSQHQQQQSYDVQDQSAYSSGDNAATPHHTTTRRRIRCNLSDDSLLNSSSHHHRREGGGGKNAPPPSNTNVPSASGLRAMRNHARKNTTANPATGDATTTITTNRSYAAVPQHQRISLESAATAEGQASLMSDLVHQGALPLCDNGSLSDATNSQQLTSNEFQTTVLFAAEELQILDEKRRLGAKSPLDFNSQAAANESSINDKFHNSEGSIVVPALGNSSHHSEGSIVVAALGSSSHGDMAYSNGNIRTIQEGYQQGHHDSAVDYSQFDYPPPTQLTSAPSDTERYNQQGVALKDAPIPEGSDRPGAYSGTPGNEYDRLESLHLNDAAAAQASFAHDATDVTPFRQREEVEQAPGDEEEDATKLAASRRPFYIKVAAGLLIVIVIIVVIAVVAGGGSGGGEVSAEKTSSENPAAKQEEQQPDGNLMGFNLDLLPGLPQATLLQLNDPDTPQSMAFTWLSDDLSWDGYPDWQKMQRFAMATIYFSLNGNRWSSTNEQAKNWMDYNLAECDWLTHENACTESGHVRSLKFSRLSGFKGTVPPEIQLLEHLEEIDFSNNILNARLEELFPMRSEGLPSSIKSIHCSLCRLKGSLPTEVGLLSGLQSLELTESSLTGSMPTELGLLTGLNSLLIDLNDLGGPLPSQLGLLTSLTKLALSENKITGAIPSELGNLSSLLRLEINLNSISGSIPSTLGLLTSLLRMDMDNTPISGTFPSELGLLSRLTTLDLLSCSLTGTLPTEVGGLESILWFGMATNSISGQLPTECGRMAAVKHFDIPYNRLTGTIPSELGLLTQMTYLNLIENSITGTIPSEIESLPNLQTLNVF